MRERPLVYLVPPMAAALYAAVCLEMPVQLHIIAPIALLLVLAIDAVNCSDDKH